MAPLSVAEIHFKMHAFIRAKIRRKEIMFFFSCISRMLYNIKSRMWQLSEIH